MPRKKKDLLDPLMTENPEPDETADTEQLASIEEPEPPEAPQAPPPAPPQRRRFVSNTYPSLGLGINGEYHRFNNGELITDDPDVIAAIENHPWFKIHIHNG